MNPAFTFFCDATQETGMGHFSRCKRIAQAIDVLTAKACNIVFAGDISEHFQREIKAEKWTFQDLPNPQPDDSQNSNKVAIVDSYTITNQHLKKINSAFKATAFIDDFNMHDFSETDLVINFRFGYDYSEYRVRKGCFGVNYFPASEEMIAARKEGIARAARLEKRSISSVLVYLNRLHPACQKNALKALDQYLHGARITILAGLNTPEDTLSSSRNTLVPTSFANSLTPFIVDADVVICSGGLIKYEAGFCMTPNASINQTKNQHLDTIILAQDNLTFDFGLEDDLRMNQDLMNHKMKQFLASDMRQNQFESMQKNYHRDSSQNIAQAIMALTA